MRLAALLCVVAACGRVGYDIPPAGSADAMTTDAGSADALTPASGPFSPPVLVARLSDPVFDEDDPSLTGDMLEVYFKTVRGGNKDIFGATRNSIDDDWSNPVRIAELSTPAAEDTPEVSHDGLTMYLSSNRGGKGMDIYRSIRADRGDPWSPPVLVEELSAPGIDDYAATTDGSGTRLLLNRGPGEQDLFASTRTSVAENWQAPTPVGELNTPRYEADAVIDRRGRVLFYTHVEADGLDMRQIYVAERPTRDGVFSPGTPVTELNSSDHDEDPWISPDLSVIFFSRTVGQNKQIFMATR